MNDTQQIRADLAKCKQRIADMTAGRIGVIPESYRHMDAGAAFDNQHRNLITTQERLETELVIAMLNRGWGAGEIIRRMEMRLPEAIDDDEESGEAADSCARIGHSSREDASKA